MKIVVCVKQVPAISDAPMDSEKGVLVRTGENKINPYDQVAIETALQIKERCSAEVVALTMGPSSSEAVLRTALAMGADKAVHLSDRAFAGADVLATAKTLAQGIDAIGGADLIVCGQQTTDGDTAQVPFSLAAQMDIPVIGWVRKIDDITNNTLTAEQELTGTTYKVESGFPLVIAVNPSLYEARMPGLRARLKASKMVIQQLTRMDLEDKREEHYGLLGSPTRVVKLSLQKREAKHPLIEMNSEESAELLWQAFKVKKEQPHE